MITKGIIRKVYRVGESNEFKCLVEIPIFQDANLESLYTTVCPICYTPGNLNSFVENDVVYLAFEDDDWGNPVIIGKLYRGKSKNGETESRNHAYANSLEVTNSAILPNNTKIGNINFSDLLNTMHVLEKLDTITAINKPLVSISQSALKNLYGYDLSLEGYSTELQNKVINGATYYFYVIKYNYGDGPTEYLESSELNQYLNIITGTDELSFEGSNNFRGAILFTNGEIAYPKIQQEDDTTILILMIVNYGSLQLTTEARVREIIAEYSGEGDMIDMDNGVHTPFTGAISHNTGTGETEYNGFEIEVKDLIGD